MAKVSVVLPVYNVEEYLGRCIDSLLRQTLRDIEIVCVDDGSTDGSGRMLDEYSSADSRVRTIHIRNSGAAVARNVGMDAATGEYLFFHDADDWCDRKMLAHLYGAAARNGCDVVVSGMWRHDEACRLPWAMMPTELLRLRHRPFSAKAAASNLFVSARANLYNKIYRREFVVENGIRFQSLPRVNDLFFSYSAVALAKRIDVIGRAYYHYRTVRPGSIVFTAARIGHPLCWVEAFRAVKDRLAASDLLGTFSPALMRALLGTGLRDMLRLSNAAEIEEFYGALRSEVRALSDACAGAESSLSDFDRERLSLVCGCESPIPALLWFYRHAKARRLGSAYRAVRVIRRLAGMVRNRIGL